MQKRIITALLSAMLASVSALSLSGCGEEKLSTDFKTADDLNNGAILQVFSWDFNTIKESIPDIAAAGYSALQTSPINECLEGDGGGMELYGNGKWYYHYQPTDFKIGNYQLGTREEFKEMCDEAHKYGLKVLVDVIANHTTTNLNAVSKDLIEAGGGSFETLFHKGSDHNINDYDNRLECTTAKMGGLPDINTERPSYQEYFLNFINDCIDCGADGFRHDTAKHIGLPDDPKENDGFKNNFWERVTKDIHKADDMFIYGEVLQGGNDRLDDYIREIGRTTASTYGSKIRGGIANKFIDTSNVKEYWVSGDKLSIVTWVESHDNYINDSSWVTLDNDKVIEGWAIIAARKDGTPLFFSRPYMSSIENEWGMNRIGCQGDDMYKDRRVRAVNFFRTAMAGEDEELFNPNESSTTLVIERGKKGAVIVNIDKEAETGFDINLPDGSYTDRVDEKTVYTVKGGKLTSENPIPANSVVVLYNEGYTKYAPCANVGVGKDTKFNVEGDSESVTLTLENAESGEYSINGGKAVSFKDGDTVKIEKPESGEIVKLEMRAENAQGVKTYERAEFTFRNTYTVPKGTKIYFEKPGDWSGAAVYIYNYADDENRAWPGEDMKKESDGKYSYTFTDDFDSPLLIFNDGEVNEAEQYPGSGEKGLEAEADKIYKAE